MKEWNDKYNPFNSLKLLTHVPYWRPIKDGIIPPPICVPVDLDSSCNLNCSFCNSAPSIGESGRMGKILMDKVIKLLRDWGSKSICLGGGGESFLNPDLNYMLQGLHDAGIGVGSVTNGTILPSDLGPLLQTKWIGISVDAGTAETYALVKGSSERMFAKVLKNIQEIAENREGSYKPEIEFKFLVTNKNYQDIYKAIEVACWVGSDYIQIRPGGDPWYKRSWSTDFVFDSVMIESVEEQIDRGRKHFENDEFKVFWMKHKFDAKLQPLRGFKKCWAAYTTCLISPAGMIGLCVSQRGNSTFDLCYVDDAHDKNIGWGSPRHKQIVESIDVSECPTCPYTPINEIFENVILEDKMGCIFY